ncbi:unnamed protein product [Gongylonema pulchrum]|uniref:Protein kinase domain-containing protein n=1 Tax=Gongylonema pulchrum TaxID=637853 RepID=A0A183CY46_9BILA|nr:unnamed protein product [Gongylonema pulchrum]
MTYFTGRADSRITSRLIISLKKGTITELINWHILTQTPLSESSHAILKKGIERPKWLIKSSQVRLIKKLGQGAFGEVFFGEYTDEDSRVYPAAVKTMHEKASRVARLSFLKEARIMRKFDHPNIVHIFGIVVDQSPMLILMELCPGCIFLLLNCDFGTTFQFQATKGNFEPSSVFLAGGSALSFLRKYRGRILPEVKMRFVTESAAGMEYLEQKNCIHRDVAARNCLLTSNNHVKISDFGMSDEKTIIQDKSLDKVPIKWLAPETMQTRIYTIKSDVWSFGIMVWEIYSEGYEPYPSLSNIQTRAKIIVQNYRMSMPEGTPPEISALVAKCWAKEPADRPSFAQIVQELKEITTLSTAESSSPEQE